MSSAQNKNSIKSIYFAASLGTFVFCMLDLLKNSEHSLVVSLGNSAVTNFFPSFPLHLFNLVALLLSPVFGLIMAFIHRPETRPDAFMRGFAISAMLALIPTQSANRSQSDSTIQTLTKESAAIFFIPNVYANSFQQEKFGLLGLTVEGREKKLEKINVTILGKNTSNKIELREIFPQELYSLPYGHYEVFLSAKGFRNTKVPIEIKNPGNELRVTLEASPIPKGLQQVLPFSETTPLFSTLKTNVSPLIKTYLHEDDLSHIQLKGFDLTGIDLSGKILIGANFTGAILNQANFTGAVLNKTNFAGAKLHEANFTGAVLNQTNFMGANLAHADLSRTYFTEAFFQDAVLTGTKLPENLKAKPPPKQ